MKLHDMNDELLNELNLQDIKNGAKKIANATSETIKGAVKVAKDEFDDNVSAFKIFIKKFKGHPVTEDEFRKSLEQIFKDNIKLLTVAGIGALPGSVVTLPITLSTAKKFGIELIPSKTF